MKPAVPNMMCSRRFMRAIVSRHLSEQIASWVSIWFLTADTVARISFLTGLAD